MEKKKKYLNLVSILVLVALIVIVIVINKSTKEKTVKLDLDDTKVIDVPKQNEVTIDLDEGTKVRD